MKARAKTFFKWGSLIFAALTVGIVGAQETAEVLAISKPPPPVVPSDAPQGLVFRLPADMTETQVTFDTEGGPQSLEYLHFDHQGTAFITFDDGPNETAPGGVMVVDDFLERSAFDPARDRLISGANAGLLEPKDLSLAGEMGSAELGFVIVSDFGAAKVAVFETAAEGDAAPLFVTENLGTTAAGEPRRPWGLAFDMSAGRLFVGATDGTVLVFDDYLTSRGEAGPDRIITPFLDGSKASANIHDLVYLPEEDVLLASDVGSATTADQPGFDTDGKVFVLADASSAEGDAEVQAQLTGTYTMLGNPVGLAFDGENLFVTERTRDVVLRFDNILELSGDVDEAPSGAITVAKPEAVVLVPNSTQ